MFDRRRLLGLAAAVLLSACATGPDVKTDADPTASFVGYRNWTWAHAQTPPPGADPVLWQRTRDAIAATLDDRGYSMGQPAQFAVGFTLGARDKIRVDDMGGPYYGLYGGFGGGLRGWGGGAMFGEEVSTYTEGTLTIDIFDVATQRAVWHGQASQEIDSSLTPAQIQAAVAAVLARFPPGSQAR